MRCTQHDSLLMPSTPRLTSRFDRAVCRFVLSAGACLLPPCPGPAVISPQAALHPSREILFSNARQMRRSVSRGDDLMQNPLGAAMAIWTDRPLGMSSKGS